MDKLLSIKQAAQVLGVSITTLRRWEKEGTLSPDEKTNGGQRRYRLSSLDSRLKNKPPVESLKTIAYARVSSHDQKEDLVRQRQLLELHCASHGWKCEVLEDLGSGLNYQKRGLKKLLSEILSDNVSRLVITHKDRLLRFGSELVFSVCEAKNVEVVILNKGENSSFEEDLAKDVLEIITVFSARLYGSRSHKNKKLIDGLRKAAEEKGKE